MTVRPTPRWADPEAAWWAKLRRAQVHITAVKTALAEYEASESWTIEPEPGPEPNQVTYRLRVHRPVPSDVITMIGDAVHNLRTALDAVAYELARGHVVGTMTAKQEQATEFPLCQDRATFDAWCSDKRRAELYGDAERLALLCVQPFALDDEARALGVDVQDDPDLTLRADALFRLHRVSVIDKHRRLPLVSLYPDLIYWPAPDGAVYHWQPAHLPEYADGVALGTFTNTSGTEPPSSEPVHEMRLTLTDDPGYRPSVGDALDSWLSTLRSWVLPRMMVVVEGHPPPIMFHYAP